MHCLWTGNTKVPIELHAQVIVYSWRIILNTMSGCAETKMNYLSDKKTTFAGAVVYENTWLNHTLSLGSTLFSKELRFHLMNHFNTDKNTFFRKKRLFIFQREILQRLKKVFLKKIHQVLFISRPKAITSKRKTNDYSHSLWFLQHCYIEMMSDTAWHLHFETVKIRIWNGKFQTKSQINHSR